MLEWKRREGAGSPFQRIELGDKRGEKRSDERM